MASNVRSRVVDPVIYYSVLVPLTPKNSISYKEGQSEKAHPQMHPTPLGRTIVLRDVHPFNTQPSIQYVPPGNVNESRLVQLANA